MTTLIPGSTDYFQEEAENRAKLVAQANSLIPLLRDQAEETERSRRLTPPVEDALRSAGMFRVCTPKRSGGAGGGIRTLIEVTAELARGDGSAGWVAFIANTTGFLTALLPDDVRAEVYSDRRSLAISQFGPDGIAKEVDGGYKVTGRWPFSSGSLHAEWTISGVAVVDASGEFKEPRWALMRTRDLVVEDTWHVAGMCGTGSNTQVAQDLFVPAEHTIDAPTFTGQSFTPFTPDEPGYRAPVGTLACIGLLGAPMGLAEAAWDLTLESMKSGRPISYTYEDIRDSPSYRLALADARNLIDTGRFHLLRACDIMDHAAHEGRVLDIGTRAALRGDAAAATKSFRDAVDLLLDIGGTRAFASSNPLQRIWRDLGISTRHGLNNRLINREEFALYLLDQEQAFPLVL